MEQFLNSLVAQDVTALENLLAQDVVALSDGGGVYRAALKPLLGRDRVIRFYLGIARRRRPIARLEIRELNGAPALLFELGDDRPHEARRFVIRCDLDAEGRMRQIHAILAPKKLASLRF
jgi:RNA polymerase sigma-70 factor (ECF subfamily)